MVLCSLYSRSLGYCGCGKLRLCYLLLNCCVKGLVLLPCGMEDVVVCISVCVVGWLWQAICERVMRLLGSVFAGCSLEGDKFCVRGRCCWLTIWLRFLFLVVCLPCMFCWLVLWGIGRLDSRCEFRQASNGFSLGRVGGWYRYWAYRVTASFN